MRWRFLWLFVLFFVQPCTVSGQNAPASPTVQSQPAKAPPIPSPGGPDRQIKLDVQVTDRSDVPIRGLQQQDFTILDNKQAQNVLSFHAAETAPAPATDPPVEIVLVIDGINTSYQVIASARRDVKTFLLQNYGKLAQPVSLIFVSGQGTKVQNSPSRDGNAVAVLYDRYATALQSSNLVSSFFAAEDRFNLSIKAVASLAAYESTRPGRKLMIWISSGWPLFSGGNLDLNPKDWQQLFNSVVALSSGLRQARITLYSVDPLGALNAGGTQVTFYQQFLKGVTSPSRMQPGYLGLQVLAVQSGGRVYNSTNDLTAAIAGCAADADAFYTLSFDVPPARHANEYHAFTVTVDKPGVTVRSRAGYYAQP